MNWTHNASFQLLCSQNTLSRKGYQTNDTTIWIVINVSWDAIIHQFLWCIICANTDLSGCDGNSFWVYFSHHCACCRGHESCFFNFIKTVCIQCELTIWNTSIYENWTQCLLEKLKQKHCDLNLKNENGTIIFTTI